MYTSQSRQIWGTMNDDQRVWIVGSFLHFACNEGFTELKGYDLSEADAKGMMAGKCDGLRLLLAFALACFMHVSF